jgi:hypothetical protein
MSSYFYYKDEGGGGDEINSSDADYGFSKVYDVSAARLKAEGEMDNISGRTSKYI